MAIRDSDRDRRGGNLVQLMLDSGIFGAWARGERLDIKKYIRFIKDNEDLLFSYVSMDQIPGTPKDPTPTPEKVEESAKISYDNHQIMKSHGLRPIPVFHQGEQLKWLERYLVDGEDYIGISTHKLLMVEQQSKWLDKIYSILTDSEGRPYVKTHGFGITNGGMLLRYPFYTVDSTTWSLTPAYGQVLVPPFEDGKFNYHKKPEVIIVSGVVSMSGKQDRQLEFLGESYQDLVRRYLEEEVGVSLAEARHNSNFRRKAVLTYYLRLMEELVHPRFDNHSGWHRANVQMGEPIDIEHMTVMFATQITNRMWSALMNEVGAHTRLLSYYELKNRDPAELREYVSRGTTGNWEPKTPKVDRRSETYGNWRRLNLYHRIRELAERPDAT